MLRITIELVPHGDESRTEVLETVLIVQVEAHDDLPGGERTYAIWRDARTVDDLRADRVTSTVRHQRVNGALMLAGLACTEAATS